MTSTIGNRKDAHIDLCLNEDVSSGGLATGLGGYTLPYDALPEVDLDAIDLSITILGKRLNAPLIIGAMTGGTERAKKLNQRLARAAERVGVGMALGSQRAMVIKPELTETFVVRDVAPKLPLLIGNIGAVQLNYGVNAEQIATLAEAVSADAVNFHLNALQEAIQPEGDTRFSGLKEKMGETIEALALPCLVKEVGAGISAKTAKKLAELPIAGIEVAGVGGTSWAKVESFRAPSESVQAEVGRRLAGFGVPTAVSIKNARAALDESRSDGDRSDKNRSGRSRLVVASGGVRTGMDVAVAIALGADVAAFAKPLLQAANESEDAAVRALETIVYELKVICFCTGAKDLEALKKVPVVEGAKW